MKFEEASLTEYLVKNLGPLTEANPVILAKYVVALLKKDKPVNELQKLCTDNLVEFLGHGAKSFTTKLFEALEDGSIIKVDGALDAIQISESSQTPIREGTQTLKNLSPKEENLSTSSESSSDTEDKEVSDDDDADRNHKHRRRLARPNSFETNTQEQFVRRPSKKRNKPCDNGQVDILTIGIHKEFNPNSGRNISSNFDKRRSSFASLPRAPLDLGPRTRFNQPFRGDIGPRFDLSTYVGRPIGRGRGRGAVPWNQHDSRFNPHDTLDFDALMASQDLAHPSLFAGAGLNAASTQNSSWAGFGFIAGMPNGIMDPLIPLGLQGTLMPTINPRLNLAMPRQRCKDFEERGFCLRGDMCPMEHGLNRIVVEDVQSLSQFNLPVSIPSSHGLGIQAGSGQLPVVPASSGQLTNIKSISNKSSKSGVMDDAANLNHIPSTSIGGDADRYDPDQPSWNNDRSGASAALLRLPSPNIEDEPSGDDIENEDSSQRVTGNNGSLNTSSSVWGRIGSGHKSDTGEKFHNMTKEDHEDAINSTRAFSHGKSAANMEIDSKTAIIAQHFSKSQTDSGHKSGRAFHKAFRTLYVNGVPQKTNRRDELISHFKKFGEVIDIYIPLNSEKAFVQFSKREEAEAALKSPDAVMGNRFIKLSWANRDRILDDGQSSGHGTSVQSPSVVTTPLPFQQTIANGGKGIVISAQTSNSLPATERPMAAKSLMSNFPKAVPPTQKKPESLELLEELRMKQESLAKKREEFKRQLEKFEKQANSSNKVDAIPEQAAKRQKVDVGTAADKAPSPKNLGQVDVKTSEKKLVSKEVLSLNGLKANSKQQSLKSAYQTTLLPASLPSRYKLDNRSATFRILPPLPAGFANVTVLKDHFSHYGVISSVVLDDPDHVESEDLCKKCSVRITFATRQSAERAYQNAKCWDGHSLQFKWLTVSQNFNIDCGIQETSSSSPMQAQRADFQLKRVASGSSSSGVEKLTCSVISEVGTMGNVGTNGNTEGNLGNVGTNGNTEGTDCPPISMHKSFVENSRCGPTISSHKESPDALTDEDGINVSSTL